jgi:flagellar biosynthetic protein FliR
VTFIPDPERVLLFTMLLARATGLVAAAPFFGERMIPVRIKALVSGALALLMLSVAREAPPVPESLVGLVLLAGAELSVGLVMGFSGRLFVMAFEMAGQVVAVQMGFGMAAMIDPLQPHRTTLMGRWMWLVGMTVFLGLGGHHHLLRAVAGSLELVPPGQGLLTAAVVEAVVDYSARGFVTALSIAAPAIGLLLLTSMGLGILARTVPQMNVFIVGFPLKITTGIVGVMLSLPYLLEVARREVAELARHLSGLILAA